MQILYQSTNKGYRPVIDQLVYFKIFQKFMKKLSIITFMDTSMIESNDRIWKTPHTVLEGQILCFSSYKNRKLKVKL